MRRASALRRAAVLAASTRVDATARPRLPQVIIYAMAMGYYAAICARMRQREDFSTIAASETPFSRQTAPPECS